MSDTNPRELHLGRLRGGLCVYWYDDAGKRHRHGLEARTEAEARAEAVEVYQRETARAANGLTVADLWPLYIRHLGTRPTAKTLGYTGKAILPFFGPWRPEQIDTQLCRDYAARRIGQGKSIGTVHTELGHLQMVLNWSHRKARLIDFSPLIERPEKPDPVDRWLTEDEIARICAAAHAPHISLSIILLISTGARIGAILELTWDRIDFERGIIDLRKYDTSRRKGRAIVPMNNWARAALTVAGEAALTDHVIEYGGRPVASIKTGMNNAIERAKLDGVTIHVLRHTAGVHMAKAGVPMAKISQYLGHNDIRTTERIYARYAPEFMADAAHALDFSHLRVVK